jgi:hypothetical protein
MEKFQLSFDQLDDSGGFAADAGDCRGGKIARGAVAAAGILKARAAYCVLRQAARQVIT